jgi:dipeptidyl aminopeptidase/acylaminoacyl peptidase
MLRVVSVFSAILCALLCAVVTISSSHAAPPAEAYGSLPAIATVEISPSGARFAAIVNEGERQVVVIRDSKTGALIGGTNAADKQKLRALDWYSDDRLLVYVQLTQGRGQARPGEVLDLCRIVSVPATGGTPLVLLREASENYFQANSCGLVSKKGPEPDTILVAAPRVRENLSGVRQSLDVYSVNVVTGKSYVVEKGTGRSADWRADSTGKVRLRIDHERDRKVVFGRVGASDDFTEVYSGPLFADEGSNGNFSGISFLGFSDDPNRLYVYISHNGRGAIALYDIATKTQLPPVVSDPVYDVAGVMRLNSGRIVGATVVRARPEQDFLAPDWKQLQALLKDNFPGESVSIQSSSDNLKKHVLLTEGPSTPGGEYRILDLEENRTIGLGRRYPGIPANAASPARFINYAASDGVSIPAYLTMPAGGTGKNLPAIVLPHGGPAARDDGDFDYLSQFLASRGYVVLQPQFRGSSGFGDAWEAAGVRQWGGLMQRDVSDGVKHLVSTGVADPKRICILGWSYGGYAAGAGATLTPDLYRCSVAVAGVFDLVEMLKDVNKTDGRLAQTYWRNHIGDLKTDEANLIAVSPTTHADKVRGPMLLIHGRLDTIVPFRQSKLMADAMQRAGKPVELLEMEGEDHSMSFAATRIRTLKAMETFLSAHNPR